VEDVGGWNANTLLASSCFFIVASEIFYRQHLMSVTACTTSMRDMKKRRPCREVSNPVRREQDEEEASSFYRDGDNAIT